MIRRVILLAAAAFAALGPVAGRAQQSYPNRLVKIIAPVQPGGGVDLVARTVADQLGKLLKATFIVENIAGGGGVIASQSVAHAAPDGYTLMIAYVGTHGTSPAVRKLPYDAVRDFTPIAMVGGTPNVLVVNSSVPAKDMTSFLDYVKKNPGKLSYGSAGQGSLTHLAMEQFKSAAGFDAVHAAYRGIGPAITDTLGGQTQMMMPGLAAALPHIRGGMLKPIAVTGLTRHRLLPDVPTFKELGYPDFEGVQWYGIAGPAGMPADLVAKLNAAVNESLNSPALRERLAGEALETMPMTPVQFAEFIRADIAHWSKLASEHNIKLED